jgi:D-amino-acid dehydrogenase
MQRNDIDVLILGAGAVGLACALQLLRAGRKVVVIDQGLAGRQTSHGNCGTITPSHATPLAMPGMVGKAFGMMLTPDAPLYVKPTLDPRRLLWLLRFALRCNQRDFDAVTRVKGPFLMRARAVLADLIRDEGLDCEFEQLGTLYTYRDPAAFAATQWLPRALAEVGIPIETLDGARARQMEPALNEHIIGAYFNPGDAHLRPDRYVAALAARVRTLGGEIVERTRVEGFVTSARGVERVRTAAGDYTAREVVFALGAWSPALARTLGLDLPIQPGKGYSITFERPARAPRIPVVLKERSVCVTAWSSGYRLGSTMEFSGYDETLNRRRLDALTRAAPEYLVDPIGPRRVGEWYGWRPMTWDDLPIIGRSPRHRNLMLATGHGMLGITMSAVTGELVRDLVTGTKPAVDPAPFRLERFG